MDLLVPLLFLIESYAWVRNLIVSSFVILLWYLADVQSPSKVALPYGCKLSVFLCLTVCFLVTWVANGKPTRSWFGFSGSNVNFVPLLGAKTFGENVLCYMGDLRSNSESTCCLRLLKMCVLEVVVWAFSEVEWSRLFRPEFCAVFNLNV